MTMQVSNKLSESFGFMAMARTDEEAFRHAQFAEEVNNETTRGAVLNITSFIDEILVEILKNFFPNKEYAEELLSRLDGPLSSIMERAQIAYALALIKEKEIEAIKWIARIRNKFAHGWDRVSFEHEDVKKLVNKLPISYIEGFQATPKARFNFTSSQIIQELIDRQYYALTLSKKLPNSYRSIFDLSDEERASLVKRFKEAS